MFVPCINDDLITLLSNRCAVSAGYTSTVEHGHWLLHPTLAAVKTHFPRTPERCTTSALVNVS